MEIADKNGRGLRDLALIYLALAHSTDEQLSDEEIDAIAARLREWENVKTETVLSAIKQALEEYLRDDADVRVRNAVLAVRQGIPEDRRQAVLDDMMEIAVSDGRFLHEEGSFIGELARAWGLHPGVRSDGSPSWSLLNSDTHNGNWTPVHDLALIYLTLAHSTDDDLGTEELEAITDKLCEWLPDAERDHVVQIVRETLTVYVQGPDQSVFAEAVDSVGAALPEHQRNALLEDLKFVAQADGVVLDQERELIDRLARKWGIPEYT